MRTQALALLLALVPLGCSVSTAPSDATVQVVASVLDDGPMGLSGVRVGIAGGGRSATYRAGDFTHPCAPPESLALCAPATRPLGVSAPSSIVADVSLHAGGSRIGRVTATLAVARGEAVVLHVARFGSLEELGCEACPEPAAHAPIDGGGHLVLYWIVEPDAEGITGV